MNQAGGNLLTTADLREHQSNSNLSEWFYEEKGFVFRSVASVRISGKTLILNSERVLNHAALDEI